MRRKAPPAVSDPCVRMVTVEHKHRADRAVEPLAAAGELATAVAVAATRQWQRSHHHRSLQSHAWIAVKEHAAHAGHIAPRVIRVAAAVVEHYAVAGAVDHMLKFVADRVVFAHGHRVDTEPQACILRQLALIPAVQLTAAGQVADDFGCGHWSGDGLLSGCQLATPSHTPA